MSYFTHRLTFFCRAVLLRVTIVANLFTPYLAQSTEQLPAQDCGNWQAGYTELHRSVLAGTGPQRFVVAVPNTSGFSDRLVGYISVFLFGLLSRRAVQIVRLNENDLFLEDSFASPNIAWSRKNMPQEVSDFFNWRAPFDDNSWVVAHNYSEGGHNHFMARLLEHATDTHSLPHAVLNSNNSAFGSEFDTIWLNVNRGRSVRVFQDPFHRRDLYRMGLRPETAFRCIFNYLFRPRAELVELFRHHEATMDDRLTIGIQIRTGDEAFSNEAVSELEASRDGLRLLQKYKFFFDCAQEIEDNQRVVNLPVRWFLMSDSSRLIKEAVKVYGSKIYVGTEVRTQHSAHHQNLGLLHTFLAEHRHLSMTDFKIISHNSGVGRTAAFLSESVSSTVYVLENVRPCGLNDYSSILDISWGWSGV